MRNNTIREHAKTMGVHLWEIAAELNINDGNFSRKLRRELSVEETRNIIGIIDRIAASKRA